MLFHGPTIVAYVASAEINGRACLEATPERGVTREKKNEERPVQLAPVRLDARLYNALAISVMLDVQ